MRPPWRESIRTAGWALAIFLLNLFLCKRLLRTEYLPHMFSIEAAYIGLARWITGHWGDLAWFPLWNNGEPLQNTYQPGLPMLSALAAQFFQVSPARGYHIAIAVLYCLGPVGLFFLTYRLSGRRDTGVLAALFLSLLSPSAFLIPVVRHDMGSVWYLRRYYAMVFYGEGPNVCGLSLLPFALLGIDAVYRRFSAVRFLLAALCMGLVVLVSWPASVVLAMGVLAYLLSRDWRAEEQIRWKLARLMAVALGGYLLIAPLDLPSTILANQRNSQRIGIYPYTSAHIFSFGLLAGGLFAARFLFRRFRADRFLEFSFYWFLIPGSVALAAYWGHIPMLPQPERFHVGMEIGLVMLAAWTLTRLPLRGWPRIAAIAVLAAATVIQVKTAKRFTGRITRSIDITKTFEYQIAQWLDAHLHHQRVLAAGSVAFWMNAWTDQPQLAGCCLPGLPNPMSFIVSWFVPSGGGAGIHDAKYSVLWLRAWGAQAVVVGGEKTRNAYKDWPHPRKFEGILPKIWEQGDDAVYRVSPGRPSLAHVIDPREAVSRPPVNGVDVEPLRPYVRALEDRGRPIATWQWLNAHEARLDVKLTPGDWISVQETMLPGWRASTGGRPVEMTSDALGLMILKPRASGETRIDLIYDGGREARIFGVASLTCWAMLIGWAILSCIRRPSPPSVG